MAARDESPERLALSSAADADGQLHSSSSVKRVEVDNASTEFLYHVAPTLSTLPVELLIEIFAQLNTNEVRVAMRVCKTWRDVANSTTRVWRNIAFNPDFRWRCRIDHTFADVEVITAVTRADYKVVSVELSGLSDYAIQKVCQLLDSSTHTLRHILWSERSKHSVSAEDVYELAKRCPRLQTLQLRCKDRGLHPDSFVWSLDKFTQGACGNLRLQNFSISIDLFDGEAPLEPMIYDEAKALAVEAYDGEGMSVTELARLLRRNRTIEKLSLQGLRRDLTEDVILYINAPALKSLDVHDFYMCEDDEPLDIDELPEIHAPRLRELVTDAGILFKLSAWSTTYLDTLVLRVGWSGFFHASFESDCLEIVAHHRGSLDLLVGPECAQDVLARLSNKLLWPRLKSVYIRLGEGSAGALVRLIAARQAGARGASEEQYLSLLQEAPSQRMTGTATDNRQRRLTDGLRLTPKVAAEDLVSVTSSVQVDSSASPLCCEVLWKVEAPSSVSDAIIAWLNAQSNVELV